MGKYVFDPEVIHECAMKGSIAGGAMIQMMYFAEGQFEKRIYKPGDRIFVGKGQAGGMNFTHGVWAVEYARGAIPVSMPFGLSDELLSVLDFPTAIRTLSMYTSLIGRHWGNRPTGTYRSGFPSGGSSRSS